VKLELVKRLCDVIKPKLIRKICSAEKKVGVALVCFVYNASTIGMSMSNFLTYSATCLKTFKCCSISALVC